MKHIIFVEGLISPEDADKIRTELDNTSVDYSISLNTGSVSIQGSNDKVYAAKQAIQSAGYTVK